MKEYQIMIKARGQHHEGHATGNRNRDADHLLANFIETLRSCGHEVVIGAFSANGTTEMLAGTPRDLNHIDDIYGFGNTSNPDEPESEVISKLAVIEELVSDFRAEWRKEKLREQKDDKARSQRPKKGEGANSPPAITQAAGVETTTSTEEAPQIPSTEGVNPPKPEAADIEGPAPDLSERTENRADDKAPEPQA